MSVDEMKKTILKKVDTFSEEQLRAVYKFVETINDPQKEEIDLLHHVEEIVSERSDVLKKLAQ